MGRVAGCGLVLLVAASSCLQSPAIHLPERSGADAAGPGSLEIAWINNQLRPIGQPQAVGAVAVGVVSTPDRKLLVVGIDPTNGRELWRQPLTPSAITPGVPVTVTPVGDKIAYLRPTSVDTGYAELVLADATTGADVAKTPEALFLSPPTLCRNGKDVCTTSKASDSEQEVAGRLETATGRYLVEGNDMPLGARMISEPGLLDLGDRPGNTLALLRDGVVTWRTPLGAAFPREFTTDNGWNWQFYPEQHVYAGSVGGPRTMLSPTSLMRDLQSASATAALSEADGQVLWRDAGSYFRCHLGTDHPIRCRSRGTVTAEQGVLVSAEGVDVTIEGFDVKTGRTTWSLPMGGDTSLIGGQAHPPIAGAGQVVLAAPSGPFVLDLATGRTRPPPAGATFWCMRDTPYELSQAYQLPGGSLGYARPGGLLATVCDAHGETATAIPGAAATLAAGVQVGGYAVVAVKDGEKERFVGFKLPAAGRPYVAWAVAGSASPR
jgi:hypothetical protein